MNYLSNCWFDYLLDYFYYYFKNLKKKKIQRLRKPRDFELFERLCQCFQTSFTATFHGKSYYPDRGERGAWSKWRMFTGQKSQKPIVFS